MGKKNKFKRFLSFLLVTVMLFAYAPSDLHVFGNYQRANTQLEIQDRSMDNSADYNFILSWILPRAGSPDDLIRTDVTEEEARTERASGFRVYSRNASDSAGGSYGSNYIEDFTDVEDDMAKSFPADFPDADALTGGSIYAFKIQPYHTHTYLQSAGAQNTTTALAPYEAGEDESEALYMTDIGVTAEGSGTQLKVTWDNPLFDGEQVFTHYRINYDYQSQGQMDDTANTRIISMDDPMVIFNDDGTVSYTIIDDNLQIGLLYSVKVEPMVNSSVALRTDGRDTITTQDGDYPISYTPPSREYRYDQAYVQPALRVVDDGPDGIRIEWDTLIHFREDISRIEVQQSTSNNFDSQSTTIGTIRGNDSSKNINYWPTARPAGNQMYYRIVIYYGADNTQMVSEVAEYAPGHTEFTPYKPIIFSVTQDTGAINFTMLWEAFLRDPYTDPEKSDLTELDDGTEKYLDIDMDYNIWITDDLSNFDSKDIEQLKTTLPADTLTPDLYTYEYFDENANQTATRATMAYNTQFAQYIKMGEGGVFEQLPIEENKVYYVRIIAARDSGETSQPAFYSFYVAPTGNLPTAPVVISTPPLRIKTTDGLPEITDKDFTIQWDTKWFEVYDEATKSWYATVGYDETAGKAVFGKAAEELGNQANVVELNDPSYYAGITENRQAAITAGMDAIRVNMTSIGITDNSLLPLRFMDLDGCDYAIHVVNFDTMMNEGGYDQYYNDNLLPFADTKSTEWQADIAYQNGPDHPDFTVTQEDAPDAGPLKANTPYVVYFLPYMDFPNVEVTASYPSYLSLTTTTIRVDQPVDPTVPQILYGDSKSDTSITVRWKYTPALQYELAYAELLTDYPDNGTVISTEDITANGEVKQAADTNGNMVDFIYYNVKGLFPDTSYYFWVRSYTSASTDTNWSNPIQLQTDDIAAPLPPQGLGVAAEETVSIINTENGEKFMPTDSDYIIVEWLRNYEDINSELAGGTSGSASATPPSGTGAEEYTSPAFDVTKVVKFNDLIANRPYYIRVKTRLTVTQGTDGVEKLYTYIVQLAKAEDFLDPVELEVSEDTSGMADGEQTGDVLQRDSDWAKFIIVYTRPWTGEYDGDKNPDMYPLPVDDFEVTYDDATNTLKYRFLSDGANENLVDQRLISKLVQNRTYVYYIDLSSYEGEDIKNRSVELPYSIVQAFDERKIGLQLIADNVSVTFNPGWMATDQMSNISDFGRTSKVTLNMEADPSGLKQMTEGDYVSAPQRLSANVRTNTNNLNMSYSAAPLTVDLKLQNRANDVNSNVDAYVYQTSDDSWQMANSSYDSLGGKRTFDTPLISSYAAAALPMATSSGGDNAENSALNDFTRQISVTDAHNLDMNADASSYQMNNIMAALAMDKNSFELNGFTTDEESNGLARSGLLLSGSAITREEAVNSMMKLYEKETGYPVSSSSTVADTPYTDIAQASPQYQQNMLKAADLGFFGDDSDARPTDNVTLGEAFYMANIILQDR